MIFLRENCHPLLTKVNSWNTEVKKTGGLFIEKCCHFFHLIYLLSKSKPFSVYASGNLDTNHLNEYSDNTPTNLIDNAYITINFENGIRACIELCMFCEGTENQTELSIIGNKAKIECFIPSNKIIISNRPKGGNYVINSKPQEIEENNITKYKLEIDTELERIGSYCGSLYWQHFNLINYILFKKESKVDYKQGLVALIIAIAAQESIKQKKLIDIRELIENDILFNEITQINF